MSAFRAIVAAVLVLMSVAIGAEYWRVRRVGLLLGALAYAGGGFLALAFDSWWPLLGGFASAWLLRAVGAEPRADLRFDLPVLERGEADDAGSVRVYLEKWMAQDPTIALLASSFVAEAWRRGFRKPPHVPDGAGWSSASPAVAWQEMVATDVRRLASSTRQEAIRYLDEIDDLGRSTLMTAVGVMNQYKLPPSPPDFALIENAIPDGRIRAEYASAYVADAMLAARLRVLAWNFQHWYGERYETWENRRKATS